MSSKWTIWLPPLFHCSFLSLSIASWLPHFSCGRTLSIQRPVDGKKMAWSTEAEKKEEAGWLIPSLLLIPSHSVLVNSFILHRISLLCHVKCSRTDPLLHICTYMSTPTGSYKAPPLVLGLVRGMCCSPLCFVLFPGVCSLPWCTCLMTCNVHLLRFQSSFLMVSPDLLQAHWFPLFMWFLAAKSKCSAKCGWRRTRGDFLLWKLWRNESSLWTIFTMLEMARRDGRCTVHALFTTRDHMKWGEGRCWGGSQ